MLIMMSVMASAHSEDGPEMTILAVKSSEVIKVIYKGSTSPRVKLNIFDSQGNVIHSTSLAAKNGFICPLNFKGLPSGSYTIEVIDDQGSRQETVNYVAVHDRKSVHVSKLLKEPGKFLFTVANAQDELVTVRIYDQHDRLLYSESKTLKGDFAQVYRMPAGFDRCTFEISDTAGNEKSFVFKPE